MRSKSAHGSGVSESQRLPVSRHLARLFGFALMPATSLLASVVLLPLISRSQGPAGWVALGVGQGIGAILGVIAALAWPVVGGNAVARADEADRPGIFVNSVYSRLLALVALLPVAITGCLLLVDDYRTATTFFMIGTAMNALGASWFYAGLGEPRRLVINEGVVRLVGYAVSAIALARGAPLAFYAMATVAAAVVSLMLNWIHIVGLSFRRSDSLFRDTVTTLSEHRLGTASRVLHSGFVYGGTPIFAAISPASASVFAALEQLQRATANATAFVPQTFVSWVGGDPAHTRRRSAIALSCIGVAAAGVLAGWTAVGPVIVNLLFAGEVQIGRTGCFLVGLNVATGLLCACYQLLVMIPLGMKDVVFKVSSIGAVAGVIMLAGLSMSDNELWAFSTWSITNGLSLVCLVVLVRRHILGAAGSPSRSPRGEGAR